MKVIYIYIPSMAIYDSETLNIWKRDKTRIEAFKMRCWGRLLMITWKDRGRDENDIKGVENEKIT